MRKTTPPVDAAEITLSGDALIELSPLGLMLSSQRKILLCNTAFAHLFGYEASEMQGASLAMLYPSVDEFERIGQRGWQVMAREGQYRDERLMRRRDGHLIWVRVHGRAADLSDPFQTASWVFEPLSAATDAERLTPREREVLAGMAKGQTAKDSARELGLSPRTVEKLRGSLRAHFGARNAAELMSRIGGMPG